MRIEILDIPDNVQVKSVEFKINFDPNTQTPTTTSTVKVTPDIKDRKKEEIPSEMLDGEF